MMRIFEIDGYEYEVDQAPAGNFTLRETAYGEQSKDYWFGSLLEAYEFILSKWEVE